MTIPLVDLRAQYEPLKDEIMTGIEKVFDSMHLFLGENVQCFGARTGKILRIPDHNNLTALRKNSNGGNSRTGKDVGLLGTDPGARPERTP